jgi:hypothetical protein
MIPPGCVHQRKYNQAAGGWEEENASPPPARSIAKKTGGRPQSSAGEAGCDWMLK